MATQPIMYSPQHGTTATTLLGGPRRRLTGTHRQFPRHHAPAGLPDMHPHRHPNRGDRRPTRPVHPAHSPQHRTRAPDPPSHHHHNENTTRSTGTLDTINTTHHTPTVAPRQKLATATTLIQIQRWSTSRSAHKIRTRIRWQHALQRSATCLGHADSTSAHPTGSNYCHEPSSMRVPMHHHGVIIASYRTGLGGDRDSDI